MRPSGPPPGWRTDHMTTDDLTADTDVVVTRPDGTTAAYGPMTSNQALSLAIGLKRVRASDATVIDTAAHADDHDHPLFDRAAYRDPERVADMAEAEDMAPAFPDVC